MLFWIDLLCRGINSLNCDPVTLISDIDNLMFSIDACLMNKDNFYHIRILKILNQLVGEESLHEKIANLDGFKVLITYVKEGSVDFVI